jgi:hypothetical protein
VTLRVQRKLSADEINAQLCRLVPYAVDDPLNVPLPNARQFARSSFDAPSMREKARASVLQSFHQRRRSSSKQAVASSSQPRSASDTRQVIDVADDGPIDVDSGDDDDVAVDVKNDQSNGVASTPTNNASTSAGNNAVAPTDMARLAAQFKPSDISVQALQDCLTLQRGDLVQATAFANSLISSWAQSVITMARLEYEVYQVLKPLSQKQLVQVDVSWVRDRVLPLLSGARDAQSATARVLASAKRALSVLLPRSLHAYVDLEGVMAAVPFERRPLLVRMRMETVRE